MIEQMMFTDALEKLEFARIRVHISSMCVTGFGKEHTERLTPSSMYAFVRDELARVDEMRSMVDVDDRPPFDVLEDMRPALHRAVKEGSVVASSDFLEILHVLVVARNLKTFFSKRAERSPLLAALASELHENKLLEFHIDRVVDDEGNIKDSASRELRIIRRGIIEKSGQLRRRMEAILKRVADEEMVMEDLVTMRDGRLVLPVKTEYKRRIQGFIHSTSATGQTVYIEPTETLDLNNEIRDLQFAEIREVNTILTELTDRLRGTARELLHSVEIIGRLDSFHARARYGHSVLGCCPRLTPDGHLELLHARHPLLLLHKRMKDVIPLDITLGDEATTTIITGPNAGGKSVAMKTVGLLTLMVQSGIPVPCDEHSSFPCYDSVHVDIGDEQSLENDLSTFSSHISRLSRIVAEAGPRSLVLIDEIGTGTDPSEGSALGAAILERLTQLRAHVISTTHHGMLKAFAHEQKGMCNAAMEFDMRSLQPTYVFRAGLPGSSYAFEITRRHGMDVSIIERAQGILGTQSDALESLLADVEQRSGELGVRLRQTEQKEDKLNALVEEYESKLKLMKREAKDLKRQSLEQAERILSEANAAVEEAVRGIREEQASKEAIRRSHARVEKEKEVVRRELEDVRPPSLPEEEFTAAIHAGDEVRMRDQPATRGVALSDPAGGKVEVAFGSLRMTLPLDKLQGINARQTKETVAPMHVGEQVESNEIDVRGMYGDEAITLVDRFLTQAWSIGLERVDIIHGKGTGALRQRVHDFLRDLSFVERFELGEWNEGGSGMTKVFFRGD